MARTLVVGDPVVALGPGGSGYLADGALIVEGRTVAEVGPREVLEQRGPFDRVVGSSEHVVVPGFINGHFHGGSPLSRGMAQYIFERANVHVHGMWSDVTEEDLYNAVLWHIMTGVRGGQTGFIDFNYGRPGLDGYGYPAILRAYRDLGVRVGLGVVTRDRNRYVHADDDAFIAALPPDLGERVRASSMVTRGRSTTSSMSTAGSSRNGTATMGASGSCSHRTGRRRAPTSCTWRTGGWPTITTRASPPMCWRHDPR